MDTFRSEVKPKAAARMPMLAVTVERGPIAMWAPVAWFKMNFTRESRFIPDGYLQIGSEAKGCRENADACSHRRTWTNCHVGPCSLVQNELHAGITIHSRWIPSDRK